MTDKNKYHRVSGLRYMEANNMGYEKHVVDENILSRLLRATRYLFGSKGMRVKAAVGMWKPGALSAADARDTKRSTAEILDVPHGDDGFGAKGKR